MGEIETPNREHDYFIFDISLFIKSFKISMYLKIGNIYSTAIQLGNFVFYLVGILGLIYLLDQKSSWEKYF